MGNYRRDWIKMRERQKELPLKTGTADRMNGMPSGTMKLYSGSWKRILISLSKGNSGCDERNMFPDLKGKSMQCPVLRRQCVAVFGFQALGAKVTAADISWKQVENGRKLLSRWAWILPTIVRTA